MKGTGHKRIILTGKVETGLGEGAMYMGNIGYKKQFVKKLGIDPYLGTLNVRLYKGSVKNLARIRKFDPIRVLGFKKGGRNFGGVACYRTGIRGVKCALIIPDLSRHTDMAEIISSVYLRGKLVLKDGSGVKISVTV